MNEYELRALEEIEVWKGKLFKKSSLLNRISKKAQIKLNEKIPERVHQVITDSLKNLVKATLVGSEFTTKKGQISGLSLEKRDEQLKSKLESYRKAAQ